MADLTPPGGGPLPEGSGWPQQPQAPQPQPGPPQYGQPPGWGPVGWPQGPQQQPPPQKANNTPLVAGLAVLLLLVAVVVGILVTRGGGTDEPVVLVTGQSEVAGGETFVQAEGEIFLEPAVDIGPDPFSTTFTADPPPTELAQEPQPQETRIEAPPNVTITSDDGALPGLYGGTRNNARCDPDQIADFLEADPAKAAAWVAALNADPTLRWSGGTVVATNQIRAYLDELTPVILRTDTRVTNHGFSNGRATARQSVLQAGTAVLVDAYGVPRVRCGCGNPLLPPRPANVRPVYVGRPWPGFNPVNITVIQQTTTIINVIQIIDINTGQTFVRPVGTVGGEDGDPAGAAAPIPPPTATTPQPVPTLPPDVVLGTGDVQVTVLWSSDSDMDLHVTDPEGFEISFGSPSSPSGGELDHDDIPGCGQTGGHAENVFWEEGGAPSGQYQAFVRHFTSCAGPQSYQLEIKVGGQVVATDAGTLAAGESSAPIAFTVR